MKDTRSHPASDRKHLRRRIVGGLAAIAVLVAACGGNDDPPPTGGGTTTSPSPTGGTTPDPGSELSPEIAAAAAAAEAAGLQFITSREELLARAEAEGTLNVIWALAPGDLDEFIADFESDYPQVQVGELAGLETVEARQRIMLELSANAVSDYGVLYVGAEVYNDMLDYCDWDLYGMAETGIIDIPVGMIDHNTRKVMAAGSSPGAFMYRIEAYEDRPLPTSWDDFLDPEIYSSDRIRLVMDVLFRQTSAIVPAWGLERTIDYVEQITALNPIWSSRNAPFIQAMQLGEYDAFPFLNLQSVYRRMEGAPPPLEMTDHAIGDVIGLMLLEPVPVRLTDTHCVFVDEISDTPASAILFLEWLANDGQNAYHSNDLSGPAVFENSIYSDLPGGNGDLLSDLEVSVIGWDDIAVQGEWIEAMVGAAGFPQAVEAGS